MPNSTGMPNASRTRVVKAWLSTRSGEPSAVQISRYAAALFAGRKGRITASSSSLRPMGLMSMTRGSLRNSRR